MKIDWLINVHFSSKTQLYSVTYFFQYSCEVQCSYMWLAAGFCPCILCYHFTWSLLSRNYLWVVPSWDNICLVNSRWLIKTFWSCISYFIEKFWCMLSDMISEWFLAGIVIVWKNLRSNIAALASDWSIHFSLIFSILWSIFSRNDFPVWVNLVSNLAGLAPDWSGHFWSCNDCFCYHQYILHVEVLSFLDIIQHLTLHDTNNSNMYVCIQPSSSFSWGECHMLITIDHQNMTPNKPLPVLKYIVLAK